MPETARKRLYFDNAATSFPKPPEVAAAVVRYLTEIGASPGRGAYAEAIEAGRIVARCRELVNRLINGASPDHVVFTLHTTDALNLAIKGIVSHHRRLDEPVHIVTTRMDHNSILRPLNELIPRGIQVTRIAVDPQSGLVDPDDIRKAIRSHTRLVATIHGSNVTGSIQPVGSIGATCAERGVPFLVDAAQTIGHLPIDVQAMNIDLLAFPGHKGLLGPLGTGGLCIRPGLERSIDTLREGGTGSMSDRDIQPTAMPDKYEAGSANAPGLAGLAAGVEWILNRGVERLWQHEQRLIELMIDGLRQLPGLHLLGSQTAENRCGVFSFVIDGLEPAALAGILEEHYGILARAGIHCAPLAHETLGTRASGGATRLSLGPFLTEDDVRYAVQSIAEVCHEHAALSPMTQT
jgi:cysteine desulfurase / selenocysteine lyase